MLQTPPERLVLAGLRSSVAGDIYAQNDPGCRGSEAVPALLSRIVRRYVLKF